MYICVVGWRKTSFWNLKAEQEVKPYKLDLENLQSQHQLSNFSDLLHFEPTASECGISNKAQALTVPVQRGQKTTWRAGTWSNFKLRKSEGKLEGGSLISNTLFLNRGNVRSELPGQMAPLICPRKVIPAFFFSSVFVASNTTSKNCTDVKWKHGKYQYKKTLLL